MALLPKRHLEEGTASFIIENFPLCLGLGFAQGKQVHKNPVGPGDPGGQLTEPGVAGKNKVSFPYFCY